MKPARNLGSAEPRQPLRGEAGFTLLELLVTFTVVALLVPLVFSGFRFAVRTANRADAVERANDVMRVRAFLRRELSATYPAFLEKDPADRHIDFSGGSEQLEFLARTPAAAGGAARSRFVLRFVNNGALGHLLMTWHPEFGDEKALAAQGLSADTPLLEGVSTVRFAYYGRASPKGDPRWHDVWQDRRHLPALIRMRVAFPAGDRRIWPDLIIAPMVVVDSPCNYDLVSKRCRRRPL